MACPERNQSELKLNWNIRCASTGLEMQADGGAARHTTNTRQPSFVFDLQKLFRDVIMAKSLRKEERERKRGY